jgi:hypothetical protein
MSLLVGLTDPFTNSAILLADSRVAPREGDGFDACQKVARLGRHGLVGFDGNVALGAELTGHMVGAYTRRGTGWLASREAVQEFLRLFGASGRGGDDGAAFVAMLPVEGRIRTVRFDTEGRHAVLNIGITVAGGTRQLADVITPRFAELLNFAGAGDDGLAQASRVLLLADWIISASQEQGVEAVGGLMQAHLVNADGAFALPYERWMDVTPGHGTYVRMDVDDAGRWVQVHEPSQTRVPLRFPGEPEATPEGGSNYELVSVLKESTPGVEPTPQPLVRYRPPRGRWHLRR